MTDKCRCAELEARIAALETRLGMSRQPTLFAVGPAPLPGEKYPAEFERCWEVTGKRGAKAPALKAWVKAGRPPHALVSTSWTAYMRSERPVRLGAVMDFSTWLNKGGHTQEWRPAREANRPGIPESSKPPPTLEAPRSKYCWTHTENIHWTAKALADWCPGCKEQKARQGTRTMTEDEAMELPPWADLGGGIR